MSDIRQTIIDSLSSGLSKNSEFLETVQGLVETEGEETYPILLNVLTHLEFNTKDAKSNWDQIIKHQSLLETKLERPVKLITAMCDYFSEVSKNLQSPTMIELKVLEETRKVSRSDGLTGLFNRRFFDETLDGEISKAIRYDGSFSLIFFDLDNFKNLNDTWGHQAGDLTLKRVAEILILEKRTEDIACRYGGEELVLILPETQKINALVIAERIRQKVEELKLDFDGKSFGVTLSGGVASYPTDAKDIKSLIHAADVALYQAKESGRNRIFLHALDKRHYIRIDFAGEVHVSKVALGHEQIKVQGKNFSSSGLLFESPISIEIGAQVQVQITDQGIDKPIIVKALVARVEKFDTYYDIGIAFLEIDDTEGSEIAQTLAKNLGIPTNQISQKYNTDA
ncbi:MAG: diguanylate cyclase [Nitrospina sp.]|jgi:diguanylate cyclase (GGDEF)-like protein|nr:diguanylate cyclase [Nitrospina sp.]MBT3508321.1 diguanylate cyclase [Nitrospina sp.]MBT3874737.1 diguanylate cyclase [Nitrospina sp.]MBT4049471.1 diguanylate cyclase [Nitrospina sp.]MBT4558405.1 diguanylate cyclase [Nitrospina sp.]